MYYEDRIMKLNCIQTDIFQVYKINRLQTFVDLQ